MIALLKLIAVLCAALYVYLAVLATVAVARDYSIGAAGRAIRLVGVWVFPWLGAFLALRSTGEIAPDALPGRRWLHPVMFLLTVKPRPPTDLTDSGGVPGCGPGDANYIEPGSHY